MFSVAKQREYGKLFPVATLWLRSAQARDGLALLPLFVRFGTLLFLKRRPG